MDNHPHKRKLRSKQAPLQQSSLENVRSSAFTIEIPGSNQSGEDSVTKSSKASSATIPITTKLLVHQQAGGKCWLCGLNGKHVAHVIASSDEILLDSYREMGLIYMNSIHALENLIYLCPGCHSSFDERVPAWVFLPEDLSPFLKAEEDFQKARAEALQHGKILPRPAPEKHDSSLRYVRYQIRVGFIHPESIKRAPIRRWPGNPIATILRSAAICSGVPRLHPVDDCGIPDHVMLMYQKLLFLYGTPQGVLPRLVLDNDLSNSHNTRSTLGGSDDGENSQESGSGGGGTPRPDKKRKILRRQHPRGKSGEKGSVKTPKGYPTLRKSKFPSNKSGYGGENPQHWVLGPSTTSEIISKWWRDGSMVDG